MNSTTRRVAVIVLLLALSLAAGCDRDQSQSPSTASQNNEQATPAIVAPAAAAPAQPSLRDARKSFQTHILHPLASGEPVPAPPPNTFNIVQFAAPAGNLSALLTVDPRDGAHYPAIIWITGGDCNTIGDMWTPKAAENDQSAAAYRDAGIVTMFPSLRGGNQNPGHQERFYGEVDDILAAADFLATQRFVDPKRIYLGGHSTGGTLSLLTAECSNRFRAVFSFGAVDDIRRYGNVVGPPPFDTKNPLEFALRSPIYWLSSLKGATFVFEGDRQPSNASSLNAMARKPAPPDVHFMLVHGASHFSILAPMNRLIAKKIIHDTGPTTNISFSDVELAKLFPQR